MQVTWTYQCDQHCVNNCIGTIIYLIVPIGECASQIHLPKTKDCCKLKAQRKLYYFELATFSSSHRTKSGQKYMFVLLGNTRHRSNKLQTGSKIAVAEWLLLSLDSKEVLSLIPSCGGLWEVCIFSPYLLRFPPGALISPTTKKKKLCKDE